MKPTSPRDLDNDLEYHEDKKEERRKKNAEAQKKFRERHADYVRDLEETVTNLEAVVLNLQQSIHAARCSSEHWKRSYSDLLCQWSQWRAIHTQHMRFPTPSHNSLTLEGGVPSLHESAHASRSDCMFAQGFQTKPVHAGATQGGTIARGPASYLYRIQPGDNAAISDEPTMLRAQGAPGSWPYTSSTGHSTSPPSSTAGSQAISNQSLTPPSPTSVAASTVSVLKANSFVRMRRASTRVSGTVGRRGVPLEQTARGLKKRRGEKLKS
ncbi:hypothetical protein NMY22_g1787 [Coprinellus aureogranulatus]|nr:hypothetical protein NMY22_g1787 [Coprinellus aureogranulatus]